MTGRIWAYVAAIACRLCLALAADPSVLHPMGTSRGVLDRLQSLEAGAAVGSHSSCAALSKLLDDARRDNAELRRDNAELRKLLDEREAQLQMSRGNSQTTALQSVPVQPDDSVRDASFHLPSSTIVKMPSSQALGSGALPHSSDVHSDGSRTSLLHRRGLLGKVGVKNAEEMRSRYSSPCWPARSSSLNPACRCITSQAPSIARPGADIKIYLDDVDGPGILLAVVHALPPRLLYRISADASRSFIASCRCSCRCIHPQNSHRALFGLWCYPRGSLVEQRRCCCTPTVTCARHDRHLSGGAMQLLRTGFVEGSH